jgi:hypothetical protein
MVEFIISFGLVLDGAEPSGLREDAPVLIELRMLLLARLRMRGRRPRTRGKPPEGTPIVVPHRFESERGKTRSRMGTLLASAHFHPTTSPRLAFYDQKFGRFALAT